MSVLGGGNCTPPFGAPFKGLACERPDSLVSLAYTFEGKYEKASDHGPLPVMLLLAPGLSVPASTASLPPSVSVVELARGTPSDTIMHGITSTQTLCFPIGPRSVQDTVQRDLWGGLFFFLLLFWQLPIKQQPVPSDKYSLVF